MGEEKKQVCDESCQIEDSKECKAYIGVKIVKAAHMLKSQWYNMENKKLEGEDCEGYIICYPDGYKSWSPKWVFEQAYRLISDSEKLITKNH